MRAVHILARWLGGSWLVACWLASRLAGHLLVAGPGGCWLLTDWLLAGWLAGCWLLDAGWTSLAGMAGLIAGCSLVGWLPGRLAGWLAD